MPTALGIPFPHQSYITEILLPERFVQMILRLEVALDFGRCWPALTIERPAFWNPHEEECQQAHHEQERNRESQALEEVHGYRPVGAEVRRFESFSVRDSAFSVAPRSTLRMA